MDFGFLPLLKTGYVFVTEFLITMCYWLLPYAIYLWLLPPSKAGGRADRLDHPWRGFSCLRWPACLKTWPGSFFLERV